MDTYQVLQKCIFAFDDGREHWDAYAVPGDLVERERGNVWVRQKDTGKRQGTITMAWVVDEYAGKGWLEKVTPCAPSL